MFLFQGIQMIINLYLECKSFWIKMSAKCANIWINFQTPTQHHACSWNMYKSTYYWFFYNLNHPEHDISVCLKLNPLCECVSPAGSMWLWLWAALPGGSDWLKLQTPAWQSTVYYIVWQLFHSWLLISGN